METQNVIETYRYESPCGEMLLGSLDGRLCLCDWEEKLHMGAVEQRLKRLLKADYVCRQSDVVKLAEMQLDEYFDGRRRSFSLPLLFVGTAFQKTVWRKLLEIPYGTAISYGVLAAMVGNAKAVRAVALANGANALSIVVPCHRVVGSDGSLVGYGGGLAAKQFLLELEKSAR